MDIYELIKKDLEALADEHLLDAIEAEKVTEDKEAEKMHMELYRFYKNLSSNPERFLNKFL